MARPTGVYFFSENNHLGCPTSQNWPFDLKREFSEKSNQDSAQKKAADGWAANSSEKIKHRDVTLADRLDAIAHNFDPSEYAQDLDRIHSLIELADEALVSDMGGARG